MKRLRTIEWEAVAGLLAAIVALVLHFLHVTDTGLLRVITLVLVALLFLRELRKEGRWEALVDGTRHSARLLEQILAATPEPEIDLIGPSRLQCATARFAERCHGTVVWFNACPEMLASRELCDTVLRPFLANPAITAIRFVLDHRQRDRWQTVVSSTLGPLLASGKAEPPIWGHLDSGVSFMLADTDATTGRAAALVSFWGEPFMAVHHDRRVPGYVIHVHDHSELIGRLREVERACHPA
jgi:hypothetical protein